MDPKKDIKETEENVGNSPKSVDAGNSSQHRERAKFRDYPNVHVACGMLPSEFSSDD